MDHSRNASTDDRVYTVTTYVAAPGTPTIDQNTGQRGESLPGHMYYKISDGHEDNGYGFAPLGHGRPLGQGGVSRNDFESYQNPVYARTIEITRDQYEKLKEFGNAGVNRHETYFDLTYNGATNSCIDFTWGALNHAGLHQQLPFPNGQSMPLRTADGEVLPVSNIAALQSIPAPIPDSPYNRVETNPPPPRWAEKAGQAKDGAMDRFQDVLDDLKCEVFPKMPACPPDGASLDPKRALPDPRDPASPDHRMYKQIEAGVTRHDAQHGRDFDGVSERLSMQGFVDAKAAGLTSADHVVLNEAGRKPMADGSIVAANTSLIVIQGSDPYNPAANRSITQVAQAVERPLEDSLQKLASLSQQQAQTLAQQPQTPTQDDPSRGSRTM